MLKLLGGVLLFASVPACASELVLGDFKTDLIPHPVPYAVLLPDGYKDGAPLTKKQIKAVEKTFPPPLRLLTYETGHFICSQKRTFSLANDASA
jgi:hypothetical protein